MTRPYRYWESSHWIVTKLGLRTIDVSGPYVHVIKARELYSIDNHYLQYLEEKGWVQMHEFKSALDNAIKIHAWLREQARLKAKAMRDRRKVRAAVRKRNTCNVQ